jgi:hypothetical protein
MILLTSYLNTFAPYDAISGRVLLFFVVHRHYSFCLSPYTPPIAAPQHTHTMSLLMFLLIYQQAEAKILKGPHEDLENYLEAIAKLRSNIQFFGSKSSFKNSDGVVSHASSLLNKAISKLQDEFNQLLLSYRFVFCTWSCPSLGMFDQSSFACLDSITIDG